MKYEVTVTHRAERNLLEGYEWYARQSIVAANRWYNGVVVAMTSLEEKPERCPFANENDRFPIELRQLLFGLGRRRTHRIVFTVRPDRVMIYAVRHVAQRDLDLDDLANAAG